jgi:hypothetical protein
MLAAGGERKPMTTPEAKLEYRIERDGDKFIAIDPQQETVGVYATEEQAHADIECEKRDDAICERLKELMRNAVRTLMAEFALDLETALDSINSAAGMTALAMDDEPKR